MELTFTEEQRELRRAARRFLQVESSEERVRAAMATERGYDPAVWRQLSEELAWTALTVPDAYGGLGMSYLDLHPLMEEMGRALLCAPFFSTVCLAANALVIGGSEAQKDRYLPAIASGELRATLAHAEKNRKHGADSIEATCVRSGNGFRLTGRKDYVVDGHTADVILVPVRAEKTRGSEGVGLCIVSSDADGLRRIWTPTVDQTRKQASIELDGVIVSADAFIGGEGSAWPIIERTLDLARIALAAEQVGGAEGCLEMSVEYAKVRKQFGRAIGSFQAIKHKCADMLTMVESARSASLLASALAAQAEPNLADAASSAKAFCSETFFHCASENIQIHGGIGFTWEHAAHLYFKRAKSDEVFLGDPAYHRERVAECMGL